METNVKFRLKKWGEDSSITEQELGFKMTKSAEQLMAGRILLAGIKQQYNAEDMAFYVQYAVIAIANGSNVQDAISEAKFQTLLP